MALCFDLGKYLLEGVGMVDGIVVGKAVEYRAVIGGEANHDGAAHGQYAIGDTVDLIVCIGVGVIEEAGLGVRGGGVSWVPNPCWRLFGSPHPDAVVNIP